MPMTRPNIIYVHSHDTGRYVQPYGHAVPTPNIQRLGEQGVLFRHAFCAAPTCSASRAALLTGQSAHAAGMTGLVNRGWELADFNQHLVRTLQTEGNYHCVLAGIQHVAKDPGSIGYDQVVIDRPNPHLQARAFLDGRPPEPFFLDVGFFETHRAFPEPDSTIDPRFVQPPDPLPDVPEIRKDMAAYHMSARTLDEKIGVVLDAIDRNGLAGNTLVICTTDHGIAFPLMKCHLTDHGMGVMLLLRGPGGFDAASGGAGKVIDGMVSQVDLFPTICDLARIERPGWLTGTSILPLVRGEVEQVNEAVFAEVSFHAAYDPRRCVRTTRWKYIRQFDERRRIALPNCDDSPSKAFLVEHGWAKQARPREMLFDLVFDPSESNNRADDPDVSGVLDDCRGRLERWMRQTKDPLLQGPVPAPPGTRVNDADGQSPQDSPRPGGRS